MKKNVSNYVFLKTEGFLLVEVLLFILLLAIAFTSFSRVLAQSLQVAKQDRELRKGLEVYEQLIFELENGFRPRMASDGGRGSLEKNYGYEFKAEGGNLFYEQLTGRFFLGKNREFFKFDLFISKGEPR